MAASTQERTTHNRAINGVVDGPTDQLVANLQGTHTLPLWTQMAKYNPPSPNPRAVPHIWRYREIEPHLIRAGELITEKQAERRVLMLINPARNAPFTTDTLYAGLQLVMPNETAPAHRHTAFAMRFIISGTGGFTAVHGKRITMNRGDVILTPTWNWHDHGKDGSGPMIWLDGLDLPNFQFFPVHFVEHFQEKRYPAEDVKGRERETGLVFPWADMKKALDGAEEKEGKGWVNRRYLKKDGREVSLRLGGAAERISPGASSPVVMETSSSVYHVIEGSGYSLINSQKVEWGQNDTFCIPAWCQYQHFAGVGGGGGGKGEPVYLYRFDDQPMLKALGFYRVEGVDVETYVSD